MKYSDADRDTRTESSWFLHATRAPGRYFILGLAAVSLLLLSAPGAARAQQEASAEAVRPFLAAQRARALAWSPDGTRIAYQVEGTGSGGIRVHSVPSGSTIEVVPDTRSDRRPRGQTDLRWASDGERLVYRAGRRYYTVAADGSESPKLLVHGDLLGDLVQLSPDLRRVSFIRDGSLWVLPLDGGEPRRLTPGEGLLQDPTQVFSRLVQWPQWSPDSRRITYLSPTGGGHKLGIVEVETGAVSWHLPEEDIWRFLIVDWSPGGDRLAVSRLSGDFRRKELVVTDVHGTVLHRIREDADTAWVSHNIDPAFYVDWSPDGESLAFLSNRGGWRHLYVAEAGSGRVRRLTDGPYDVMWAGWTPEGDHLSFISNRDGAHRRLPWIVPVSGGEARLLYEARGIATDGWTRRAFPVPNWSPDGSYMAFPFSGPEDPYQVRLATPHGDGSGVQIHSGLPDRLREGGLPGMNPVSFRSRDGTRIPGVLWLPPGFDEAQRYPALVYMYGGWSQMATLGWYAGFGQMMVAYLASRGYVVLIADPRGAEGYGDAHAKGIYLEGGGRQVEDLLGAADYLAGTGYVDPSSIALYGHSYGAYLTLQTLLADPETYRAGILVAGVYDWQLFNPYGRYSHLRFGSPDDPAGTFEARARPARRVADLAVPVLAFHGTADINVPISHSELLVSELLRAGRTFEYMVYPGEAHSWGRPETIRDFLARVEDFLGRQLGEPPAALGRRAGLHEGVPGPEPGSTRHEP